MEKWICECDECQHRHIEVYPDGLSGDEAYSDFGEEVCTCAEPQYKLVNRVE